jgi:putative addiction module killer protein
VEVRQTDTYAKWFRKLDDSKARFRILARLRRLEEYGHAGDHKAVGDGVLEMRIDHGPGYRIYFVMRGDAIVILLCGGSKQRQDADIEQAKRLAKEL